jgi:hypothetical protein
MQGFASFHEEWNSIPASIVDEQNCYIKGWGYTVIAHCLIFSVPKVLDATTDMALLLDLPPHLQQSELSSTIAPSPVTT